MEGDSGSSFKGGRGTSKKERRGRGKLFSTFVLLDKIGEERAVVYWECALSVSQRVEMVLRFDVEEEGEDVEEERVEGGRRIEVMSYHESGEC